MAARYIIRVKDHTGTPVALLTEWRRLEYTRRVNAPDSHVLSFTMPSDIGDTLHMDESTDFQIEVWRQDLALTPPLPSTLDYEGFHLSSVHNTAESGLRTITSYGRGYDDLLSRRSVLYPSGSAGAEKSGAGETVIKEFVDENAGPGATSPPRLLESGVTSGLTVEADGAAGSTWEGARSYRNLLEVVQEIAGPTLVDFGVVGTGAAAFEFRAKAYPWGVDRSTQGLDPATGLNAAGNRPVIFSTTFGNVREFTHTHTHTGEVNAVVVLGQGLEANRETVLRTDAAAIAMTPWNLREATRNANMEATTAGLNAVGDELLHDLRAQETFHFAVLQEGPWRYLRDYNLGDIVTARHTSDRHFQIVGVTIAVEAGRETITLEVQEDD